MWSPNCGCLQCCGSTRGLMSGPAAGLALLWQHDCGLCGALLCLCILCVAACSRDNTNTLPGLATYSTGGPQGLATYNPGGDEGLATFIQIGDRGENCCRQGAKFSEHPYISFLILGLGGRVIVSWERNRNLWRTIRYQQEEAHAIRQDI